MSTIVIDASSAAKEQRTGVEEYAFQIIQNFKKNAVKAGDRVILFVSKPLSGELSVLPVGWEIRILKWFLSKYWMQLRVTWELWRRPPEVFFVPAQILPFFISKKIKVITTIHDVCFCHGKNFYQPAEIRRQQLATKRAVKRADLILVPSLFTKEELGRFYRAKSEKIIVTPLAAGEEFHSRERTEVEAVLNKYRLGYKNFFLFLGRVESKKGPALLIPAFEQLKEQMGSGDPLRLVFVGAPGFGFSDIKKLIDKSRYHEFISLLGYIKREDLPAIMAGASALLAPSWCEGFNLPLLEAAASGTPIIASAIPVHKEVLSGAARFVNNEDSGGWMKAFSETIKEAELTARLVQSSQARVKDFSWAITAQKTWASLEKILNQ